ncbi:XkdX family protein [Liquorilactobacillus uvarum]|nr:XkdX family protein [Liquorilactobacillus uvarum]
MFTYIQEYYSLGLYADSDLDVFFAAGMLTEDQENEIKAAKASESTP